MNQSNLKHNAVQMLQASNRNLLLKLAIRGFAASYLLGCAIYSQSIDQAFQRTAFFAVERSAKALIPDVAHPTMVRIGKTWYAYGVRTRPGDAKYSVVLYTSSDLKSFVFRGFVVEPTAGAWDSEMASFPGAYFDGKRVHLVYEGTDSGPNAQRTNFGWIGYAYSDDGIHFTKQRDPILRNAGGWEKVNIGTPSLIKRGSQFYLYYHGYDGRDCRVGLATGPSLMQLARHSANPLIDVGSRSWDSGTIGKRGIITGEDGRLYMVFEGSTEQPYERAEWSSGLAVSSDGVRWTKFGGNPVLPVFEGFGNDGPELVVKGGTYIYYRGAGGVRRARLTTASGGGLVRSWQPGQLQHLIGRMDSDANWVVSPDRDRADYASYGPYSTDIPVGENMAVFRMEIDNNTADNGEVVTIDIYDTTSHTTLGSRKVLRKNWVAAKRFEYFTVPFSIKPQQANDQIELRVYYHKRGTVRISVIGVS